MKTFADGKTDVYFGPTELGAPDDLEQAIVDFIDGGKSSLDIAVHVSYTNNGDHRSPTCQLRRVHPNEGEPGISARRCEPRVGRGQRASRVHSEFQ